MKRRVVCRFEPGEIERLDAMKAQLRVKGRAAVIRALCLVGIDMPERLPAIMRPGAAPESPEVPAERGVTLRDRIVAALEASPEAVFTPARLARAIGHRNRDSIRNTLLVLAAKGRVEKVAEGQYQARKPEGGAP